MGSAVAREEVPTLVLTKKKSDYVTLKWKSKTFHVEPFQLMENIAWKAIQDKNHDHPFAKLNSLISDALKLQVMTAYKSALLKRQRDVQQKVFPSSWMRKLEEKHRKYIQDDLNFKQLKILSSYVRGIFMNGVFVEEKYCTTFAPLAFRSTVLTQAVSEKERKLVKELRKSGLRVQSSTTWFHDNVKRLLGVIRNAPRPPKSRIPRKIKFWRGVKGWGSHLSELKTNNVRPQPTFMSVSLIKSGALDFMSTHQRCCMLEIEVDSDQVPFLIIHSSLSDLAYIPVQYEVLLPPCLLQVTNVKTELSGNFLKGDPFRGNYSGNMNVPILVVQCRAMPARDITIEGNCISVTS